MEEFGRALALEPYLTTVVLGGGFLRLGGSDAMRAELVPQIAGAVTDAGASRGASMIAVCGARGGVGTIDRWIARLW